MSNFNNMTGPYEFHGAKVYNAVWNFLNDGGKVTPESVQEFTNKCPYSEDEAERIFAQVQRDFNNGYGNKKDDLSLIGIYSNLGIFPLESPISQSNLFVQKFIKSLQDFTMEKLFEIAAKSGHSAEDVRKSITQLIDDWETSEKLFAQFQNKIIYDEVVEEKIDNSLLMTASKKGTLLVRLVVEDILPIHTTKTPELLKEHITCALARFSPDALMKIAEDCGYSIEEVHAIIQDVSMDETQSYKHKWINGVTI